MTADVRFSPILFHKTDHGAHIFSLLDIVQLSQQQLSPYILLF